MLEDKSLDEWSFDELVNFVTWEIIEGIANGQTLKATVFAMLDLAVKWNKVKEETK